jgi:hypothetical protein
MATQPGASLVKATLAIHEPPIGLIMALGEKVQDIEFQFNPTSLTLSKSAEWSGSIAPNFKISAIPQFSGAHPASMSLKILLDSSMTPSGTSVMQQVEALLSCCEVTLASIAAKQPCTPWVFFQWGSFATVSFIAYINQVSANYTLFNASGVPIRAECDLTLTQIPLLTPGQNPTSGTLTASRTHTVISGDTLQSLAWREYGDPTGWRAIAEANEIDDPMRLDAGRELLVPAAGEARG